MDMYFQNSLTLIFDKVNQQTNKILRETRRIIWHYKSKCLFDDIINEDIYRVELYWNLISGNKMIIKNCGRNVATIYQHMNSEDKMR